MNVVIAGGGTAGHVNPGIALARALEDADVTFFGTEAGAEARLVPAAGFPLATIDVGGFDRSRPLALPATAARALGATRRARAMLGDAAPDVVVGMGGYVSLPTCVAARTVSIPIVIHEQNIVFGLANRIVRRWAKTVAVSFEESLEEAGARGVWVGNPLLPEVAAFDRTAARAQGLDRFSLDPSRRTLLVFGGSQGAATLNRAAPGVAALWAGRADRQILHVTGTRGDAVRDEASPGHAGYRTVGFVDRMSEAYAVADLALCRGGASTVAELCAAALPSIIVPYPHHRDRQQERHARVLEDAGAARVLADSDSTPEAIASIADDLLRDEGSLAAMGRAARALARPDAAARLADIVREAAA